MSSQKCYFQVTEYETDLQGNNILAKRFKILKPKDDILIGISYFALKVSKS